MCVNMIRSLSMFEQYRNTTEHIQETIEDDKKNRCDFKIREISTLLAHGPVAMNELLGLVFEYSNDIYFNLHNKVKAKLNTLEGSLITSPSSDFYNKMMAKNRKIQRNITKFSSDYKGRHTLRGPDSEEKVKQFEEEYLKKLEQGYFQTISQEKLQVLLQNNQAKLIQRAFRFYQLSKRDKAARKIQSAWRKLHRSIQFRDKKLEKVKRIYAEKVLKNFYPIIVYSFRTRHHKLQDIKSYTPYLSQIITLQRWIRGHIVRSVKLYWIWVFYNLRQRRCVNYIKKQKIWRDCLEKEQSTLTLYKAAQDEKIKLVLYLDSQKLKFEQKWKRYEKTLESTVSRNFSSSSEWMEIDGTWTNLKTMQKQLGSPVNALVQENKQKFRKQAERKFFLKIEGYISRLTMLDGEGKKMIARNTEFLRKHKVTLIE